ncbi:MAG: hypothetical protein HYR85_02555 [Planctomycetes bacterium]|nr:hypothetical protein [Planctomycetota bacterium]MBI3847680.1 hypothetical protein [Planctomycetota bacterium]
MLALLLASDQLTFVHAPAHDLEDAQNPMPVRAMRVANWLQSIPLAELREATLVARTKELTAMGLKGFDALHVASAELAGADAFVTSDDHIIGLAGRNAASLHVRVVDRVSLASEVLA